MPVGRRVDLNKMSLKKDLTVTPFMPGAPRSHSLYIIQTYK